MKKRILPFWFLLTLLVILSCSGCADRSLPSAYVKDGNEYGKVTGAFFGHQWWHYYERAISYADGEFYEEALADLREAVSRREKDRRMARTYGMHFIDYFPHRELGIVYYQIADMEKAKKELERSLSQFPSAKARFYLDRVRKALLEEETGRISFPKLIINIKTDSFWTRQDPVVISGVAEDEAYVAGITIRGIPLFLDSSEKRVPFEKVLNLSQGTHIVEVSAKNLMEKTTTKRIVIHVDREGPIITLQEFYFDQSAAGREVRISGLIYDEAGVSELRINGQPILIQKGKKVPFTARLPVNHADKLELSASDQLGNRTSARIPFSNRQSRLPVLLACRGLNAQNYRMAGLFSRDTSPPAIRLRGWTDRQTVFLNRAYIEGCVSSESAIQRLTINRIPILCGQGRHIFFGHMADLVEGENVLTVEAGDEAGRTAFRKIIVIRQIPRAFDLEERMSLTVFPFEQKGITSFACLGFHDNLIDAIVDLNRFRVVERDKLNIVLREQKLSRTDLFERSTLLKLGRLVAAQSVITGSIIETRKGVEVVARLIDTETSEILATEDVYNEVRDLPALRVLAEGMAAKFHRDFPLIDGLIVERKGKDIFTDLGRDMLKLQRRLIVYREDPVKHPETGIILGVNNKVIGRARVTQLMHEMSRAELLDHEIELTVRLDRVITE
ncbi:MAG: hypothetical protein KAI50_07000 [Desulfobacterales bacterium]|nr:hypothetical protein [Desulfobacterales bacterium]